VGHHIVPVEEGGALLDEENVLPVCRDHHEIIHGRKRNGN